MKKNKAESIMGMAFFGPALVLLSVFLVHSFDFDVCL